MVKRFFKKKKIIKKKRGGLRRLARRVNQRKKTKVIKNIVKSELKKNVEEKSSKLISNEGILI